MVDAPPLRVAPIKFKFSQQIEHCRAETIEPRANTTGKWGFDSPPPRQYAGVVQRKNNRSSD
jgi:hypothetical protein